MKIIGELKLILLRFWRHPGFTSAALLTLVLGVGANAALFSITKGVLLTPLKQYRDPARLFVVWRVIQVSGSDKVHFSAADFKDFRQRTRMFEGLAALWKVNLDMTGVEESRTVLGSRVSPGLFRLLGVTPLMGRDFVPGEAHVALLSKVHLIGLAATVVGVVKDVRIRGFFKETFPELYISIAQDPLNPPHFLLVKGDSPRLRHVVQSAIGMIDPDQPVAFVRELNEWIAGELAPQRFSLTVVSLTALLALTIAVIGTYGLTLQQVNRIRPELAIRMALGATNSAILRRVLRYGLIPIVLGLILGVTGAVAWSRLLGSLIYGVKPFDLETYNLSRDSFSLLWIIGLFPGS